MKSFIYGLLALFLPHLSYGIMKEKQQLIHLDCSMQEVVVFPLHHSKNQMEMN
jgi:hypothetical protein